MDSFFTDASLSKLIETGQAVLLSLALVGLAILVAERALGLDISGVVNNAEKLMGDAAEGHAYGNPWPAIALLLGGLAGIVYLVH